MIVFIQLNSLCPLMSILIVEPEILVPIAVVDAIDHYGQALDLRVPASRTTGVKDDRPGTVLHQSALDLPHQLLALFFVGFQRLPVDQPIDLGSPTGC